MLGATVARSSVDWPYIFLARRRLHHVDLAKMSMSLAGLPAAHDHSAPPAMTGRHHLHFFRISIAPTIWAWIAAGRSMYLTFLKGWLCAFSVAVIVL
jgi:hypothetical protein